MMSPILARVPLESTLLAAAVYDDSRRQLELDFRDGTRYLYSGIAPCLFRDLLSAVSKGVFFNRCIRDRFPYTKLPPEN